MKHLLLIRFSAMGDVALLAPVVQAVTERYPEVSITLATRPKFATFFEAFPNVRVVGADLDGRHRGVVGMLRLFNDLRRLAPFDLIVDAHQNLRSLLLKNLFRLVGVSAVTIDKGRDAKKALVRKENKIRRSLLHTVERYARTFGRAELPVRPPVSFRFTPAPAAEAELSAFLTQHPCDVGVPWLGVAPFAQHRQKMWPFERFALLLERLYSDGPVCVFLFGGGADEIAKLKTLTARFPRAVLVAGQLSLAAELALIRRLQGMVCMDSSNMHFAALSGVPVLSIWGATHPDLGFGPWGQGDEAVVQVSTDELTCRPCSVFGNVPCWRGDLACLNGIPVDTVAERVRHLLDR